MNGNNLEFVKQFKYLDHIITCTLSNLIDIDRVIMGFFTRKNSLIRNFAKCLQCVKKILFNTLCASAYGAGLRHTLLVKNKDKSVRCYNLCTKQFFGYRYFARITGLLIDTGIVSGSTLLFNVRHRSVLQYSSSLNNICRHFIRLNLI